jgi:L-threonylcarbamoyladenylate synthase
MKSFEDLWADEKLREVLKSGAVAVMPTDTIYGIVGSALKRETIKKIYDLKKRAPEKPFIILIGNLNDIEKFSIELSYDLRKTLASYWPSPISIVIDCPNDEFEYLHRGTNTLAFRMPKEESLLLLLSEVGPLVAPSANTEGMPPAEDIEQAKSYFGDGVSHYLDRGKIIGKASKLIKLNKDNSIDILRE